MVEGSGDSFSAHRAVLLTEVLDYLAPEFGQTVVDGTVGGGGHAEAILKRLGADGLLIGLDQDPAALRRADARLKGLHLPYVLKQSNFRLINEVVTSLNVKEVNAVLLDVGMSGDQLLDPERGFSFQRVGPLDMRMDPSLEFTAADFVNHTGEDELSSIFYRFGEERRSRQIARKIVEIRRKCPITTTGELKELIERITPKPARFGRIHPATRVFQALRIAVNHELEALEEAIPKAFSLLKKGGRLAVISFHSLEDRIVKRFLVAEKIAGRCVIVTKKPVRAGEEEKAQNNMARSAKLRVGERT